MTILLNLSAEAERKLEQLAAANGYADVTAYVQNLVEKNIQDRTGETDPTQRFQRLAEQWQRDTKYMSVAARMAEHPAYREIVAMGQTAVPLILTAMAHKPEHWFVALREITGANPVPAESRGKVKEMANAWLQWGREQGYCW